MGSNSLDDRNCGNSLCTHSSLGRFCNHRRFTSSKTPVVGFWQEYKADNAIELLKQKLALKAKVLRNGKWTEVAARELVPGDIVRIRMGEIIPADVKLIDGDYLEADESALTGESLPVEKHLSYVAYSGSLVKKGEMNAVVTSTGMNTFFGKTAKLVEEAKTESHFQKARY